MKNVKNMNFDLTEERDLKICMENQTFEGMKTKSLCVRP